MNMAPKNLTPRPANVTSELLSHQNQNSKANEGGRDGEKNLGNGRKTLKETQDGKKINEKGHGGKKGQSKREQR